MNEIWRDISGYEGLCQISNLGRVKSFYNGGRMLKPGRVSGYLRVTLRCDGKSKSLFVHRLVAQAFIPNPESKREVNHVNGIKTDNRVENLEWVTPAENSRHAVATGLYIAPQGEDHYNAKLTNEQVIYIRENPDGLTRNQLAKKFAIPPQSISRIQLGKTFKNAGGKIRDKINTRVPDETREQIRREYVYGSHEFGSVALAKKYGISDTTILSIIREAAEVKLAHKFSNSSSGMNKP